jgi:uncharacterized PurR-regulated membrane protein YhhQ (DUF165 family)
MRKYANAFLYLLSVVAANILVDTLGIISFGWFVFPAGTILVGFVFTMRDVVQRDFGKIHCLWWMFAACLVTATFSQSLALASLLAFFVSEAIDWAVYTYSGGSFMRRVIISNVVSTPIDSAVFVMLAFGPTAWLAIIGQSVVKALSSIALAWAVRK